MATTSLQGAPLPQWLPDLIASMPKRGDGLHSWLFKVARGLHPYRSKADIEALLMAVTAGQPLQPNEIRDAIDNSEAVAWKPGEPSGNFTGRSLWPAVNLEQREAIIASGLGLVDLWEVSRIRFEEEAAELILDYLFPGNPLLCLGLSKDVFDTRAREEWRGEVSQHALIVPSPMSARTGLTKRGTVSAHCLGNTGPRRYLVVEQDKGTTDEQSSVVWHLARSAPLALVVHSAGKSLHAWFYVGSISEDRAERFMRHAVSLGADPRMWTPCQFARVPDGIRDNGARQTTYFLNPDVIQ